MTREKDEVIAVPKPAFLATIIIFVAVMFSVSIVYADHDGGRGGTEDPLCGNGICESGMWFTFNEDCGRCAADCGSCTLIVTWQCRENGWFDTGGTYQGCSGNQKCTFQNQEYRDYSCSSTQGQCTYSVTQTRAQSSNCQACEYQCVNGQCISQPNRAPALDWISVSPSVINADNNERGTISSSASDPDGQNIRLECGTAEGSNNACTSSYVPQNPSCTFDTNPWGNSAGAKTVYCRAFDGTLLSPTKTATFTVQRFEQGTARLYVTTAVSNKYPREGEKVYAYISCYLVDAQGARRDCTRTDTTIRSITIDKGTPKERNYLLAENWNQNSNYDDSNKRWVVEIDTSRYKSEITGCVESEGLEGCGSDTFGVNLLPQISNFTIVPGMVMQGNEVIFSADVTDDVAVSAVKACNNVTATGCEAKFCEMLLFSGNIYRCTYYDTSSLAVGSYTAYVVAVDNTGAWNSTKPGTFGVTYSAANEPKPPGPIPPGQPSPCVPPGCKNLNVTNRYLRTTVEYPDVVNQLFPYTPTGEPNLTRGTNVNFLARVTQGILGNPSSLKECNDADCEASYDIDRFEWKKLSWNDFDNAFVGSPPTAALSCDAYHTLYILSNKTRDPDKGLSAVNQFRFFVTCTPRVTVVPVEKRFSAGELDKKAYDVTVWNPLEAATFDLASKPSDDPVTPLQWMHAECPNPSGCSIVQGNNDAAVLDVPALGSKGVSVFMDTAARSGSYGIKYTATSRSSGKKYEAVGSVLIFAEGLAEFSSVQLIGLLFIAAFGYWLYMQKKTAGGKRKIKIRRKK
ncbi:MAG: hypothetical protein HYW26_00135 [Candidatus Aenigmarchaeota archaeon]|nr:hypothetical protein [Candidatus Aenigmarchaeota archaeon]